MRGFGPDRANKSYSKLDLVDTLDDLKKLLASVHSSYPGYSVFLLGESMGGALALRVAADNPHLVTGVICSAPAWKLLRLKRTAVKGVFELLMVSHKPGPAGRSVVRQATSDPALNEHLFSDPSHKLKLSAREVTAFLRFISKTDEASGRIQSRVLFVQGLHNRLVNPRAVAKLFSEVPARHKHFIVDAQGEHLLLEEGQASEALLSKLLDWIKSTGETQQMPDRTFTVVNHASGRQDDRAIKTLRKLCKIDGS